MSLRGRPGLYQATAPVLSYRPRGRAPYFYGGNTDFYGGNTDRVTLAVWFAPTTPAGKKGNWVQTLPGKRWSALLRLYGPLEAWLDKSWKPGDFERVD